MSNIVGSVELQVNPDTRQLIPKLNAAVRAAEAQVKINLGTTTAATKATNGAAAANTQLARSFETVNKASQLTARQIFAANKGINASQTKLANGAELSASKIFAANKGIQQFVANSAKATELAAKTTTGATSAISAGWVKAGAAVVGTVVAFAAATKAIEGTLNAFGLLFDQLKRAEIGFDILVGRQVGGELLEDIRQLAKETPFATDTLIKYSQQLLGVGLAAEKVTPLLANVGDLVASRGGNEEQIQRTLYALTQIKAAGRLIGQDALQLQNALIPITQLLAKDLGKTTQEVKELQRQGLISAEQVFETISNAGLEVTGAMEKSVKTIEQAKLVLSDTIMITLQDTEALSNIYDDLVEGIGAVATFIDSDRIQDLVNNLGQAGEKFYDALQPLILNLGSVGLELVLVTLEAMAPVLQGVATALNAIPEPVLAALGVFLTFGGYAAAAAKITTLTKALFAMSTGMPGLTRGLSFARREMDRLGITASTTATAVSTSNARMASTTEVAASRMQRAYAKTSAAMKKVGGTGIALAATLAISSLQGGVEEGSNAETGLGIASSAATGAVVGSLIPGFGTAAGAAVGTGVGIVQAIRTGASRAAEEMKEEWAKDGAEAAQEWNMAFESEFESGTPARVEAERKSIDELKRLREFINDGDNALFGDIGQADDEIQSLFSKYNLEIDKSGLFSLDGANSGLDVLDEQITKLYVTAERNRQAIAQAILADSSNTILQDVNELTPELIGDVFSGGGAPDGFRSIRDAVLEATDVLEGFGIDINTLDPTNIQEFVLYFNQVAQSIQNAARENTDFNDTFKESGAKVDSLFGSFSERLELQSGAESAIRQQAEDLAGLAADALEGAVSSSGINDALSTVFDNLGEYTALNGGKVEDALQGIYDQFTQVQVASGLSNEEFERHLALYGQLGLYTEAAVAAEQGYIGTINDLGKEVGLTNAQLQVLLGLRSDQRLNGNQEGFVSQRNVDLLREYQSLQAGGSGSLQGPGITDVEIGDRKSVVETELRLSGLGQFVSDVDDAEKSVDKFSDSFSGLLDGISNRKAVDDFATSIKELGSSLSEGTAGDLDILETIGEAIDISAQFAEQTDNVTASQVQLASMLDQVQSGLGLTDNQMMSLVASSGATESQLYAVNNALNSSSVSMDQLQQMTQLTDQQVRYLQGALDSVDGNTHITLTADASQAIAELAKAQALLTLIRSGRATNSDGSGLTGIDKARADRAADTAARANQAKIDEYLSNYISPTVGTSSSRGGGGGGGGSGGSGSSAADDAANEAERLAKEAADAAEAAAKAAADAFDSLVDGIEQAADDIMSAAEAWKYSIKERVEQERAVSVSRATRNTGRQIEDLTFLKAGIESLAARGLTDAAIEALDINGQEDVRQVRKLLRASDSELANLSSQVTTRDQLATQIAENRGQEQTRQTIVLAIVEAARILGLDLDEDAARKIEAQFNINTTTDADVVAQSILNTLTSGTVSR